eukprot:Skav224928  [mRNA]  locus=scaffold2105:59059:59517:+ [translate_table: standard]
MSDDDGELSDSTRAALRIQREIEGGGAPESESRASKAPPKSKKNDEKYGAITGIALGEYSKGSSGPAQIKMKGGKAWRFVDSWHPLTLSIHDGGHLREVISTRFEPLFLVVFVAQAGLFSESLESLAYRQDSDEEVPPASTVVTNRHDSMTW